MFKAHKKVANGIIVLGITKTSNMLKYTTNVKHSMVGTQKTLYNGDLNNKILPVPQWSCVIPSSNGDQNRSLSEKQIITRHLNNIQLVRCLDHHLFSGQFCLLQMQFS